MGVPALFRWLSKKYPKIISTVVEEDETKVQDENGDDVVIPINMSGPNPNEVELDNLYLDMNGIVHPCTHPEGKPAPETEGEMMLEIFKYTERVVNMVRPRKLLFMAIDGVAPRAKMNQQRSRRFRTAKEAHEKEEAHKESVALWEAMGKTISDDDKNRKSWDSNAITPGTPFMELLAKSLRYWVVQKMNTDPGWKQLEVIISDASVPGEGEHKIMDYIRRQRTNKGHDPNTRHVIYGLDADLIMLALATHEPHFRVLREDVFADSASSTACRLCGQEGHFAAQCTALKSEIQKPPPSEKKPFIFLDVSVLREYLESELNVTQAPFPFNLEMAIDDWVLLIFFVGNDFLPHLPSLEIREGAIDTLLKIWRDELPRMGGYVTNHGQLVLPRAQIILDGLARREDDIFRRRREYEERQNQNQNAKRRRVEAQSTGTGPSPSLNLTADLNAPRRLGDFAMKADSIGMGGIKDTDAVNNAGAAAWALGGSNRDVVANRAAIRMANLSAAETLKAELASLMPVNPPPPPAAPVDFNVGPVTAVEVDVKVPGLGTSDPETLLPNHHADDMGVDAVEMSSVSTATEVAPVAGVKRPFDAVTDTTMDEDYVGGEDVDAETASAQRSLAYKVNTDGTVEQEDTVRLWEPGYRERYYQQKFALEHTDQEFKKKYDILFVTIVATFILHPSRITTHYVEGLAWVLAYYYQGTPSWQWYYPYHFAPFAADFDEVDKMDIRFELGKPFQPFEQLMGVFPAASRQHIPEVFHSLMMAEDSPIIDFYPTSFDIDMNGKRMAWQGVALLPFIDQKRLLDAMALHYPKLTEAEVRRNTWGNNAIFTSEEHSLYPSLEALYGKKKKQDPVPIDVDASKGISGSVLPDPDCIPGSTYYSPLIDEGQPDLKHDRSLSAIYLFPKQLSPHLRRPPRVLSSDDLRVGGGRPYRGGGGGRGGYNNHHDYGHGGHASTYASPMHHVQPPSYSNGRGRYSNDHSHGPPSYSSRPPPPPHQYREGYAPRSYPPQSTYSGNSYSNGRGGIPARPMSSSYSRGGYRSGPPSRGGYGRGDRGGYDSGGGRGDGGGYSYGNSRGGFNNAPSYSSDYNSGVYDGGYNSGRGGPPRGRGRGRGY
ncbi:XRN 5'-3' exonuclease N-terminus-domain-containing protein [Russula aff. rugulosa BPL654]|nr:XRN 5'-3' exonuclease N-terminus-domain-containing protein [Russula aff. rugulosa BPL654]